MPSPAKFLGGRQPSAVALAMGLVTALLSGVLGCGNAIYAARITQASQELARAEQLGAEARAPYEYHYALEHLRKARSEAMEADYGDAIELAQIAYDYASRAVQLAQHVEPARTAAPAEAF
jgi:hypothetical protein